MRDRVNRTLAGHDGREYTSPPHHRTDALILVALLLGRSAPINGNGEQSSWSCPLAGGQRTITLDPVPFQPLSAAKRPGDDGPSDRWLTPAPRRVPPGALTLLCLAPALKALAAITGSGALALLAVHTARVVLAAILVTLALATTPRADSPIPRTDAADRPPPSEGRPCSSHNPTSIGGER